MALTTVDAGLLSSQSQQTWRNRIINGAMVIDQRNAGASVTPTDLQFITDRFNIRLTQASKLTAQQNAGSVTPPTGFTNYLGVTSSSAYSVLSTDNFNIVQIIEGYNIADFDFGKSTAKTITLSFQVYSSLTGTFGGALTNGALSRSYPFTYSIPTANTWTSISITIAGDTSGTWLTTNGSGMRVWFGLGVGSSTSGTAGSWSSNYYNSATGATSVVGTNGATFYLTGVQLEKGSTATSFDYRPYSAELAMCQRYFEKSFGIDIAPANGLTKGYKITSAIINSTTAYSNHIYYSVRKRSTPTVTGYNSNDGTSSGQPAYFVAGSWNNGASFSADGSDGGFSFNFTGTFSLLGAYHTTFAWTSSSEL
jgi:hypothetical protein